jgi:hypothetical protein
MSESLNGGNSVDIKGNGYGKWAEQGKLNDRIVCVLKLEK